MICNILVFLDASPFTLFEGPPDTDQERNQFFEDNFVAFTSCLVSSNESVRKLAMRVAKRLFADKDILQPLRASKRIDSQDFKSNFWKLTQVKPAPVFPRHTNHRQILDPDGYV